MGITINIPVVSVAPPSTGASPGNNDQNTAPSTGSAGGSQSTGSGSGQAGTENTNNTNSNFETVLNSTQSSGGTQGTNDNTADTGNTNQSAGGDNTGNAQGGNNAGTVVNNVLHVLTALDSQLSGASSAGGSSGNGSGGASTSASDALQQLQAILQQLIQQVEALGQGSSSSGAASSSGSAGTAGSGQSTSSSNSKDNPLADALAQLLAVVNQLSQVLAAPAGSAATSESSTLTSELQNVTDVLTQLSNALTAQAGNTNTVNNNAADNTTGAIPADLATAVSSVATAFEQMLQDYQGNTAGNNASGKIALPQISDSTSSTADTFNNAVNALQNALSQVSQIITSGTGKQSNDTNNSNTNNDPATMAAGQVINAGNNTQQVPSSDFVKLTPAQQAANVADQVLVQIKSVAATGLNQIKIQLDPADLGKVEVQVVTTADGKTGITITADNRQTLSMLQSEARSLESALRDIGLNTGSGGLSFNLRGQGQNTGNSGGNQGGYTQVAGVTDDNEEDGVGTITASYQLSVQNGVDIQV